MPPKRANTPKKAVKALATLEASRTRLRQQIMSTIESIENLDSAEPKFPPDQQPLAAKNFVSSLFEQVLQLDFDISHHPLFDDENEDAHQEECDAFAIRVQKALASLDAVCQQLADQANRSTYVTPGVPRVRFAADVPADGSAENTRFVLQNDQAVPPPVMPQQIVIRNSKDFDAAQRPETFRGDRLKFRTFMKQFEIFISKNPHATDCERLIALRKFVADEPKQLVDALELTEENYRIALSILEENYSRVDVDRERLLTELRSLPRVSEKNDIIALRSLVIKVQTNTKILESLGVKPESLAVLVESSINASIPPDLRQLFKQWRRMEATLAQPAQRPAGLATPGPMLFSTPCPQRLFEQTADAGEPRPFQIAIEDPVRTLQTTIRHILQHIQDYEDSGYLDKALTPSTARKTDQQSSQKTPNSRKHVSTVVAAAPQRRSSNTSSAGSRPVRPCLFCKTAEHNSSRCPAPLTIEKRRELLVKQKRCVDCFRAQHAKPEECRGPRVACGVCKSSRHYTSMHTTTSGVDTAGNPSAPSTSAAPIVSNVVGAISEPDSPTVMLTAQAYVLNGARKVPVRIFLDHGAGLTFISPSLRQLLLNVRPVGRRNLAIDTFSHKEEFAADRFRLVLQSVHDPSSKISLMAYERAFPVNPLNQLPESSRPSVERFAETHSLADPSLRAPDSAEPPGLIIGLDQMFRVLLFEAPKSVGSGLVALNSHLGWCVGGPPSTTANRDRARVSAVQAVCCTATLSQPPGQPLSANSSRESPLPPPTSRATSKAAQLTEKLWRLDVIGVSDQLDRTHRTVDEISALRQFEESLQYDGTRYTVVFPKKHSIGELQNNWIVAHRGLNNKLKRLEQGPSRYERYHQEIMKFVEDGHAAEVEDSAVVRENISDGTFYMPHHEVVTTANSLEKWRIVFNCSSRQTSRSRDESIKYSSLNDHLLAGPNLNEDLVTLLMGFRLHRVAVTSDIKSAYMSIGISEADRQLFRFLWRFPGESQIRTFAMKKVAWGATSSGFLLAATIRTHLKKCEPEIGEELARHFYADDYVQSFPSESLAIRYTDRLREALRSADMSLSKWKTNSETVAKHLLVTGVESVGYQPGTSNLFKVLGIVWSPSADTLSFAIPDIDAESGPRASLTKRKALSVVASVYDPLGLLMPFTLRGKRLIQRLWATSLRWEDPIPTDVLTDFVAWSHELDDLRQFSVPRRYAPAVPEACSHHLHVFGDASPAAFASAAYIEYRSSDGKSSSSLIMSKSRLAPIDSPPSLPRMELLAAVYAVRLKNYIVNRVDLNFDSIRFYTDSTVAYHWLTSASPAQYKTFVYNRVMEIQKHSTADQWYHVPGEENVSDLATRGISARTLTETARWWQGPPWLAWPSEAQPISRPNSRDDGLPDEEFRHTASPAVIAVPDSPLDLELFGSASHAVRVLANSLRFIRLTRRQDPLSTPELHSEAEGRIIRFVQGKHFSSEIQSTIASRPVSQSSKLSGFRLFMDENGLLRARTRLTVGPAFNYNERNPIVIPGGDRFARMLILDSHRTNAHFGISTVLSQIRRRFWITRGRQIIKSILSRCVVCRRRQGRLASQVEAPLPEHRVTMLAGFQTSGLDFCGPFFTRTREGTQRAYIALFTCAATRAIHLELTTMQSTPQTHLAIRRFLAEHPACLRFVSDNGRSFVKAATDIKRMFNSVHDREVKDLLKNRSIEWVFNCPRASFHGGFFERLVGVTKTALAKTLGKSLITFEELRTIIKELAAIINDRPITYVDANVDSPAPLTPAQLIHGGPYTPSLASLHPLDSLGPNGAVTGDDLRESAAHRTNYFKSLSVRWYREYILQLRSAQRTRGSEREAIPAGEVCLLKEDNVSRIKWPLVRIVEGHVGRDGKTRTYTIRTANGKETRRAAQLLIPLEVTETSASSADTDA